LSNAEAAVAALARLLPVGAAKIRTTFFFRTGEVPTIQTDTSPLLLILISILLQNANYNLARETKNQIITHCSGLRLLLPQCQTVSPGAQGQREGQEIDGDIEQDEQQGVLRHRSRRVHRLLAREEAPRPRLRRPCDRAKPRYVIIIRWAAEFALVSTYDSCCNFVFVFCNSLSVNVAGNGRGRDEGRTPPGAPRRGGAAPAVRGRPLRRSRLRAGHRRLRVRLPRRRPDVAALS
jgi:hypothetical protein